MRRHTPHNFPVPVHSHTSVSHTHSLHKDGSYYTATDFCINYETFSAKSHQCVPNLQEWPVCSSETQTPRAQGEQGENHMFSV